MSRAKFGFTHAYGADLKGFCEKTRLVDMANYQSTNLLIYQYAATKQSRTLASKNQLKSALQAWANPYLYGQKIRERPIRLIRAIRVPLTISQ